MSALSEEEDKLKARMQGVRDGRGLEAQAGKARGYLAPTSLHLVPTGGPSHDPRAH
eukprot:CAMPEP_0172597878 /NCGR_PEP_ID=MMETSP1068-20121228/17867_1 /TAXON_ID=35684 /ORGANISM="Pseudopedinella elastica, Strain CCMP716" /LENGTH=55 /DNA_ID=CAMNT_0013397525 /DNA_START=63 /DNA_END=228 /DNA_ORIENTATION=-